MAIGILEIKLYLPNVHSLKEKRHQILPLMQYLKKNFNISISETSHQDAWQSSGITCTIVSADPVFVENSLHKVLEAFEHNFPDIHVENESIEILQ